MLAYQLSVLQTVQQPAEPFQMHQVEMHNNANTEYNSAGMYEQNKCLICWQSGSDWVSSRPQVIKTKQSIKMTIQ